MTVEAGAAPRAADLAIAVLTYNNIFVPGGPWRQPLTILTPRFLKITAEIEL